MLSSKNAQMPRTALPSGTPSQAEARPDIRARALGTEHDDLDAAITALLRHGACDDLLITRLKKRKLQIKDEIASLMEAGLAVAQAS